jgi:hypothetical protein
VKASNGSLQFACFQIEHTKSSIVFGREEKPLPGGIDCKVINIAGNIGEIDRTYERQNVFCGASCR